MFLFLFVRLFSKQICTAYVRHNTLETDVKLLITASMSLVLMVGVYKIVVINSFKNNNTKAKMYYCIIYSLLYYTVKNDKD